MAQRGLVARSFCWIVIVAVMSGCDDPPPDESTAEEAIGFWGHGPHHRDGVLAGDTLMFHGNRARQGWVKAETTLTPENVRAGGFGKRWESPQFAATPNGIAPKIYGSVLYAGRVRIDAGTFHGLFDVAFAATNNNDVYAVNVTQRGAVTPGTILWRAQVAPPAQPGEMGEVGFLGIMSTPVIDRTTFDKPRIYVSACIDDGTAREWRAFALDLASGTTLAGWPVGVNNTILTSNGLNKNGGDTAATYQPIDLTSQRGALITSNDGKKLYVPFGGYGDHAVGWLVTIDTVNPAIVSAFSSGRTHPDIANGGLWAAGGSMIDGEGRLFTPTGNGPPGLVGTDFNWGESLLRFDTATDALSGTYTPQDVQALEDEDVDLATTAAAVDLNRFVTDIPKILAFGGKQGSLYLLNRVSLPGTLVNRMDTATIERSLLPPVGGVVNVFPPNSPIRSNRDYAHMRNSPAYFNNGHRAFLFAAGTSKEPCTSTAVFACPVADGASSQHSIAPSIARVRINPSGGVQKDGTGANLPGRWPYLSVEATNEHLVFLSPGSPEVSSNGGKDAIVWELAANVKRVDSLVQPDTPHAILYATDFNLRLLWNSANAWNTEAARTTDLPVLGVSGKYGGSPTIAHGLVMVGSDRITAFGLSQVTTLKPIADAHVVDGASAATNFGNAPRMLVQTFGTAGMNRNAYLRFSLRHVHKIGKAVLRIAANVEADSPTPVDAAGFELQQQIGLDVFAANDTPVWNEATITWNNQPGFAATPLKPLPVNLRGTSIIWYEFDITDYVKARRAAGQDVNLALHARSHGTSLVVNSGENFENRPQLVISP